MNKANELNRRAFIRTSSLATAGSVLAASLPLEASAWVGGQEAIRIALIGCGGRGTKAALQALSTGPDVRLVAMADVFPDRLKQSLEILQQQEAVKTQIDVPAARQFTGFDAYRQAIEAADVVLLATPPGFRPYHLEAAIRAGKHVFMEKPVAVDAPGIRKVLAAIREAQRKQLSVVVGLQRRFARIYQQEALPRLREGIIGDIVAANCYWNIGFIRPPAAVEEAGELAYQMRNWYQFPWLSGDHIEDTHIHNLDVVNWFMDSYPVKARGMGARSVPYEAPYGQLYDHFFVEFEYPNGVLLSSQCRQTNGCWFRLGEYFVGTRGRLNIDLKKVEITNHQGEALFTYRDREDPDPQQIEHDILFAAIRDGKPVNAAEYGAYSTMTAILGRMAAYSGAEINWEDALQSGESLAPEITSWSDAAPVQRGPDGRYPLPLPGREG